jgi:asparagine synthase (glutamine-hydrolysing)
VFTVRFPYNEELDETAHARLIANHFGVEHIELTAEPTSIELLPLLAAQFDEPLADSSMVPMHLVCKMTAQHCKVALGGDGGDELFGGYEHYTRLLKMKRLFAGAPGGLRKMLGNFADKVLPFTARGRNWIVNMGCDPESEAPHIAQLFNGRARKQLIKDDVFAGIRDPEAPEKLWRILSAEGTDIVQRASGADFEAFLPEDILVKVDRASMLNSLELRAPMLDHKVIEFSIAKIPSELKVVPDARKVILRLIGEKFFPPTFDWDRKQGFCIPLASWLRNEWKPVFEELLVKTESRVFNRSALQQLWKWGRNGLGNPERIFALALFELWLDIYRIEVD